MNVRDVVRAWKDPAYRASLTQQQRSALPENPAGVVDLSDAELEATDGRGITVNTSDPFFTVCQSCGHKKLAATPPQQISPKLVGLQLQMRG